MRGKLIVFLTVLALNTVPVVVYVLGATVYLWLIHKSQGGEDLTGLAVFFYGGLTLLAVFVSTLIGLFIALFRAGRPDWPTPTLSNWGTVAVGARTAAWGPLVLVPPAVIALAGWVALRLNG